ncbi:ATP-binding protein [Burkholderia cepacia]|uniref:ATP-binding protein n=1 Tax=Burkholderia cepacia TaxID=292 RepID=UPI002FDF9F85
MTQDKLKKFTVDARALLTLGRDSIKDHATAIIELVKNSYDADSHVVEIDISTKFKGGGRIRIADDGCGMSESVIESNWLRIGYSEKRSNPKTKKLSRETTGEKGIGRLSADRLGTNLILLSRAEQTDAVGLKIDWTQFDTSGRDLSSIEIPLIENPSPNLPCKNVNELQISAITGTELIISNLRQKWTPDDIEKLYLELSLLLPPFSTPSSLFEIRFNNDISPELNGVISPSFAATSQISLDGKLTKSGEFNLTLNYRSKKNAARQSKKIRLTWAQIAQPATGGGALPASVLGPLEVKLSFYPRKSELLDGTGLNLGQLRTFLDRNAGVRIYRDLIRVKPYGDPNSPDGDWLSLSERRSRNPAGAGRDDFRVAATQIVGAVLISKTRNRSLIDSSSREGLIDGDGLRQLRSVVMAAVTQIEALYHSLHQAESQDPVTPAARAKIAVSNLRSELSNLRSELTGGRNVLSAEQVQLVIASLKDAEREIEELASQNTVYRGLASVGIASAVFGHETEISVDLAQGKIKVAKANLNFEPPKAAPALKAVDDAGRYLSQIASWGKFALRRVNKDKRQKKKAAINELIAAVLDELERPLAESDIRLRRNLAEISAKTFAMDIEAVVVNFITNSYFAVKKVSTNRRIEVILRERAIGGVGGFEIMVLDSGPGFSEEIASAMWEPLFSTRTDARGKQIGTGLGLSIVKSAVEELGGKVHGKNNSRLGGAQFSAWFPGN